MQTAVHMLVLVCIASIYLGMPVLTIQLDLSIVFSSSETKAPEELTGQSGSVVVRRPSTLSDFSSEITGSIVTKFYM